MSAATCKNMENSRTRTQGVVRIIEDFTDYSELDGTHKDH